MKRLLLFCWIIGLSFAFFFSTQKSIEYNSRHSSILSTPPFAELDSKLIDLITLGHRGLYDDFINIWLLQILADDSFKELDVEELNRAILKVTRLQPKIEVIYMIACFAMALDLKRPEFCEAIILDGLNAFPHSWRLPMTQGFVYSNLLNENAKAAAFYNMAASKSTSPAYVGRLAKKLLNKEEVTQEDINKALDLMMQVPGGSRFADFLNKNIQDHKKK